MKHNPFAGGSHHALGYDDGPVKIVKTDYNDPEILIRRWAFEKAMSRAPTGTNTGSILEDAAQIERYIKTGCLDISKVK